MEIYHHSLVGPFIVRGGGIKGQVGGKANSKSKFIQAETE